MLDWGQLIIQLGISGAVLFVGFRIGLKVITTWSLSESERSKAWALAESERTAAIHEGFRADIAAHQEITRFVHKLAQQFSRIEGKLDTILDLTPVRDQHAVGNFPTDNGVPEAKVVVDPELRREKPGRATPSRGLPNIYGPEKAGGK